MTFASIESVTGSLKTEGPWRRENVDSWLELQGKLEQFLTGTWLFRGVTSVRHSLIASVGRRHGQYIYIRPLLSSIYLSNLSVKRCHLCKVSLQTTGSGSR